ncbi:uncharacterized protein V1513DRAFT_442862 [Lipomyces chichibuensis]|uniref:uncharacterized protein n=1 Tax=Lipomyces chichibuensis TaxID=1546026 RepID=UPI0033438AC5
MFFRRNDKAADILDRLANSDAAQRLVDAAQTASRIAPIDVPILSRESLLHKIVAPTLFMIGIITLAVIGLFVLRCVRAVLLSVNEALATSSIKVSSNNVSIPVKNIPHERYVDITRGKVYSLWMNSSAPGFKSRYWGLRDERPDLRARNRIRKRVHNYLHGADSESESGSTTSQCSQTDVTLEN